MTLECAVSGWPRGYIRWSRDGNRPLPFGRSLPLGSSALLIFNLSDEDEGPYTCEASNGGGAAPLLKASTLLQLTEPVSLVKAPKDARVEEGARVAFDCAAKGRPPPQQSWLFNGQTVTADPQITITEHQLIINSVSRKHAGIFQCFVSNSLSKVEGGAATLDVIPRLQIVPSTSQEDDDASDHDDFFEPMQQTTSFPSKTDSKHFSASGKGKKGKHRIRGLLVDRCR